MNLYSFLDSLFYSHDLVIFMYIFGVYASLALIIVLLVYTPRLRGFFSSFNGIHGTFYRPAATMFALISAFMGATLVGSSRKAMSLSMGITTALIIAVITPLALNVNHYSGLLEVSKMPLNEVYEILSEQFSDDR